MKTRELQRVKGQEHVKRGLEVAAAGGHNVLMIGAKGSNGLELAEMFPSITAKNEPVARMPATVDYLKAKTKMLGAGKSGVLVLEDLAETRRDVLETMRGPLATGKLSALVTGGASELPCAFRLIALAVCCQCGNFTHPDRACDCTPYQIQRHISKFSGPLLDHLAIHLEVPVLYSKQLSKRRVGEPSANIAKRVAKAQARQIKRQGKLNDALSCAEIEKWVVLSTEGTELLKTAILELGISARSYDVILKVARTIADLDNSKLAEAHHVSEAIGYRSFDRNIWG